MSAESTQLEQEMTVGPRAGALTLALASLNLRYGPGAVRTGGPPLPAGLSTGVTTLDQLTGCQGLPRGRISQLAGDWSSGAFDLGLALVAEVSRSATVAIVDFTMELDPGSVEAYRGDLSNCWLVRPRRPEEGWAAARALAKAGVSLCLLVAEDWSRITPSAAPSALLTALAEGGGAGLLLEGGLAPAALRERICLKLSCWRLDWTWAHGDVGGLQLEVQVCRSHLQAPGASCRLQLDFPRPYQRRPGLEEFGPKVAGAGAEPEVDPLRLMSGWGR